VGVSLLSLEPSVSVQSPPYAAHAAVAAAWVPARSGALLDAHEGAHRVSVSDGWDDPVLLGGAGEEEAGRGGAPRRGGVCGRWEGWERRGGRVEVPARFVVKREGQSLLRAAPLHTINGNLPSIHELAARLGLTRTPVGCWSPSAG